MSFRRLLPIGVLCAALGALVASAVACNQVPLDKVVVMTDVRWGYVGMGIVDGEKSLIPSTTVRVKNTGAAKLDGFQLSAAFWRTGEDGQKDDLILTDLVAKDLAPGATSEPITIRAKFGYTLAG